jgi:hypothetical protein
VLDLYEGRWQGKLLHPGDFVLCADEKPSIQARRRKHEALPARGSRGHKVEHEHGSPLVAHSLSGRAPPTGGRAFLVPLILMRGAGAIATAARGRTDAGGRMFIMIRLCRRTEHLS